MNGGSADPTIPDQYVNPGANATRPSTTPTKPGHTFGGWTLNGEDYGFNTPVTEDITLVAKWTPIKYQINYELDGGTNNELNPSEYTVNDHVIFKDPTKTGYEFDAWYTTAEKTTPITELPVGTTGNKRIYANWVPVGNVPYKIQHYKMGANGQYPTTPTLEETKYGTVEENVTATPKTYSGYQEDTTYTGRVASGTIPATGTLTLKLYYKPIEYTINYVLNGGTNDASNPTKYTVNSDTITFKSATQEGYTFLGWYSDSACTNEMPQIEHGSTGNKTVYAKWEPNHGVEYKVEHYLKKNGQYTKETTDTLRGTTGATVTATAKTFAGYAENTTAQGRVASGTIPATGTLTLKLYYDPITYRINYVLDGGTNNSANPSTYTVENTVTFKAPTKAGYVFKGWYEEAGFTTPITSTANKTGDLTIYAKWGPNGNTSYKVEHYKKNEEGEYDLANTLPYTGTTGVTVIATPQVYKGYVENKEHEDRVATGTIKPDGSLVLKLYYDPITYKINYVLNGGENNPNNPNTYTVNDTIDLQPATRVGYEFNGWYEDKDFKGDPTVSIENRAEDITLYAKWEAKEVAYKVEHYLENKDGEYKLELTKEKVGKTDSEVTAEPLVLQGYEENTTHEGRVAKGIVKADGSLVLKLYYSRVKYTVTFDPQTGEEIPEQKVPYLEKATEPNKPSREGYEFEYWYYTNEKGEQVKYDFNTPVTSNLKLIAKWKALPDTTKAPSKIPQTGEFNPIVTFSMIALVTLAGAFGFRYFKLNKMMK